MGPGPRKWADPPEKGLIMNKDRRWLNSDCNDAKLGKSFKQRKEESWCSPWVLETTDGYLKNPAGRTGLQGRGSLGLWGPNKAGDPVVVVDGATLNRVIQ